MTWQTKLIGEAFRVVNGGTPKTGNATYWGGEHQWITPAEMGDLDSPYLSSSRRTLTDEGLHVGAELVPANSIILSSRAPIGHLVINEVPMAFNQGCKGLVPKGGIDAKFAYYFLLANVPLLESLGTGATFKELSGGRLKEVVFHFPKLAEQYRIVAILDNAFAGIATAKANVEKNLVNARAIFDSYLESVFSHRGRAWQQKMLVELCEARRVITYGVVKLGDESAKGVPCLRTSNVRWLRIDTGGIKRIAPGLSAEYSRTILKGGEVLVNVRGTLGGVAVASPEMAGWNVSREVAVVPIDSTRIDPYFLSYLIGSISSQEWLGGVKKGAAYVGINIEDLRLFPVGFPSMAEQKGIVSELESVHEIARRLESLYTCKLAALDELKQSLLQQAFSGQL